MEMRLIAAALFTIGRAKWLWLAQRTRFMLGSSSGLRALTPMTPIGYHSFTIRTLGCFRQEGTRSRSMEEKRFTFTLSHL
jgi:hypothetical protein